MRDQKFVFGIVTVPYGDVPSMSRSELVDDELVAGLQQVVARLDDSGIRSVEFTILDEHGVAEWIAELIETGLSS